MPVWLIMFSKFRLLKLYTQKIIESYPEAVQKSSVAVAVDPEDPYLKDCRGMAVFGHPDGPKGPPQPASQEKGILGRASFLLSLGEVALQRRKSSSIGLGHTTT